MLDALPDGFIVETVTSEARGTTGIFAPHPSNSKKPPIMLIAEKAGKIVVLENPDESSTTRIILDLEGRICTDGERGLQSITVHPNFRENRFVYLFYAHYLEGCPDSITEGTWNVVDRFVMNPETLELDYESREEIWRTSRLRFNIHNGGAMDFGVDGKLYVTTGDSGRKTLSQPLDNTLGSIIRLNDDGSIPDDNPYTSANGYEAYRCADTNGRIPIDSIYGVCAEIYAHGFRNPFRIRMDPSETEKVRFSISDVGGAYWEELSIGGTDYAARNYGWPDWEGPCRESSLTNCPIPNDNFAMEPYHYYQHRSTREGGAVAGSVFVPPGIWPSEYSFLFIDFIFLEMFNLIEDPENECRSCTPPVSGYRNETFFKSIQEEAQHVNNARMLDIFFGPYKDTQALYVIRFGDHDTVLRIRFNDISNNAPPIADFKIPDGKFTLGAIIQFDGSVSSDPDGDELTFQWDFGDGNSSNEMNPSYQFSDLGEYDVTLKVTDSYGQIQQKTETIVIGIPPFVKIISPLEGDEFYVGESLQLLGEAYDHNGVRLDDADLTWEVRKHHADHFHPFLDLTTGNDITLYPAPEPEDYYATTNSYLRIILTATDKNGLKTTIDRIVNPSLVVVELESNAQGLAIVVDDIRVTTPETTVSWKNHNLRLEVEDQESYMFKSWSDGITSRERSIQLSLDKQIVRANFCKVSEQSCLNGEECCSGYCVMKVCQTIVEPIDEPSSNGTEYSVSQSPTIAPSVLSSAHPSTIEPTFTAEQSSHKPEFKSDANVSNKSFNFVASAILSSIIAIFALCLLPYMVFQTRLKTRNKRKGHATKLTYHSNRYADVEEVENCPFDDCSFDEMNFGMGDDCNDCK